MPLTLTQIALMDLIAQKIITGITALKKVPTMTQEEVDAETAQWEKLSDSEMTELDGH